MKGRYFNSVSQFRKKTFKIKALRKDPEASAKVKKVIQLPRMKALFNIVYFFSRLKISLQMYIYYVHIYSPHKKSMTETEGNVITKHCFGLGAMWKVSHGCGEANTFSLNPHHHFNKELPIHEKWKSCELLCWTKESEADEYYHCLTQETYSLFTVCNLSMKFIIRSVDHKNPSHETNIN